MGGSAASSDPTTVIMYASCDGGESWSLPYKFDPARHPDVGHGTISRSAKYGNGNRSSPGGAYPEDTIYSPDVARCRAHMSIATALCQTCSASGRSIRMRLDDYHGDQIVPAGCIWCSPAAARLSRRG